MKYCPFCGSGLQEAMIFCPKCGKRFLDVAENPELVETESQKTGLPKPPEATEAIQATDNITEPVASNNPTKPTKKSKKAIGLIAAALVVVLGAVGLLRFMELKNAISITDAANSVLYLEMYDDVDDIIGTASGFVIEDGTTLITNYHVIDGAHHIVAYTPDGEKSVGLHTILAYDETADLAILKCDKNIGVQPLLLGDSNDVEQGDTVYAVGYPLGLANTLSDGVVSSRYLDENNIDILQITAAISSGSSGGALFNENGEVVGVICASYVNGQNLNIAIAANRVKDLLEKSNRTTKLAKLYEESNPVRSVKNVLQNHEELDGEYVYVSGYLSSAFAYSAGDFSVVDYYLVPTADEVYGANYGNRLYDSNVFISLMQKENQRSLNYGLITIEVDWADRWNVLPGDVITVYGKVSDARVSLFMHDCVLVN